MRLRHILALLLLFAVIISVYSAYRATRYSAKLRREVTSTNNGGTCMDCSQQRICDLLKQHSESFVFRARQLSKNPWHQLAQLSEHGKKFKYRHCRGTWCPRCQTGPAETLDGWKCCVPSAIYVAPGQTSSTSLFHYLAGHARIHAGLTKEHNFFATSRIQDMRSIEVERADYALQFPVRGDGISVDISPSYGSDEFETELAPWIARHFPAMRIIFARRDPVDRLFSNFRQFIFDGPANEASGAFDYWITAHRLDAPGDGMNSCLSPSTFREKCMTQRIPVASPISSCAGKYRRLCRRSLFATQVLLSCYYVRLQHWIGAFGAERLIVVNVASLASPQMRQQTIEGIFESLGLDPQDYDHRALDVSYRGGGHEEVIHESPKASVGAREALMTSYFGHCEQRLDALLHADRNIQARYGIFRNRF